MIAVAGETNRLPIRCAHEAGADYLVTEDKDLLVLRADGDTRICRPAEFIAPLDAIEACGH